MIPIFPASAVMFDEGDLSLTPALKTSSFEDGSFKQAAQFHSRDVVENVKYLICDLCDFKRWVKIDLCHGARSFVWNDAACNSVVRAKIVNGEIAYTKAGLNTDKWIATFSVRYCE
jgi:hypothetical protein